MISRLPYRKFDYLVELAQLVIGKTGGARMTGGGFGWLYCCLAPHDKVEEVRKLLLIIMRNKRV
mgnify:CR=1 FL=1